MTGIPLWITVILGWIGLSVIVGLGLGWFLRDRDRW